MSKSNDAVEEALILLVGVAVAVTVAIWAAILWLIIAHLIKLYRMNKMRAAAREDFKLVMQEEDMGFSTDDVISAVLGDPVKNQKAKDYAAAGVGFEEFPMV